MKPVLIGRLLKLISRALLFPPSNHLIQIELKFPQCSPFRPPVSFDALPSIQSTHHTPMTLQDIHHTSDIKHHPSHNQHQISHETEWIVLLFFISILTIRPFCPYTYTDFTLISTTMRTTINWASSSSIDTFPWIIQDQKWGARKQHNNCSLADKALAIWPQISWSSRLWTTGGGLLCLGSLGRDMKKLVRKSNFPFPQC